MNKIPRLATGVAVAIALLGALGLGYWWGHSRSARADAMSPTNATTSGASQIPTPYRCILGFAIYASLTP